MGIFTGDIHRRTKYQVGDCLMAYGTDSNLMIKITGIEKYVYVFKYYDADPNRGPNMGIEERSGFIPIKRADSAAGVYRVDCDAMGMSDG